MEVSAVMSDVTGKALYPEKIKNNKSLGNYSFEMTVKGRMKDKNYASMTKDEMMESLSRSKEEISSIQRK
ncbi:hypothetical protein [Butyrivibrio sp. INlla14]|uniref:hypothetical protein n=1 Tax=Butyrivibrio sp. INlla14 TaxID=1520808 RepID=UPI000876E739|nr:hypothetical protein [Butyrivibrio sp. INlla14]SCY11401.1 hypothetical protein SAMN02910371_01115 [Butyrivibrio sp. INlla14]